MFQDPHSVKRFKDALAAANPNSFPDSIKEADLAFLLEETTAAKSSEMYDPNATIWLYANPWSNACADLILMIGDDVQEAIDRAIDSGLIDWLIIKEEEIEMLHADDVSKCDQEAFDQDGNKVCYCDPDTIIRGGNASEAIPNIDRGNFIQLKSPKIEDWKIS